MDYEMPVMDGITAVRQIMQRQPTPVLMFSSLTYEGARVSLDALDAGAADYLPKNFEDISRHPEKVRQLLCERVHALARSNRRSLGLGAAAAPVASSAPASAARQPLAPRAAATAPAQCGATQAQLQAGGHRHLHRRAGCPAEDSDPVACQFSRPHIADPANARDLHHGLCRTPRQALPDQCPGGGGR